MNMKENGTFFVYRNVTAISGDDDMSFTPDFGIRWCEVFPPLLKPGAQDCWLAWTGEEWEQTKWAMPTSRVVQISLWELVELVYSNADDYRNRAYWESII